MPDTLKNILLAVMGLLAMGLSAMGVPVLNTNGVYSVSNAAPVVQLAWNPVSGAASYNLYWGGASGQYTNFLNVTSTNATITLPARGVTYYFAATTVAPNNLESMYSTEVSYTPASPLPSPSVKPPVTLVAQQKIGGGNWTDVYAVSVDPSVAQMSLFRLLMVAYTPPAAPSPMISPMVVPTLPPVPR